MFFKRFWSLIVALLTIASSTSQAATPLDSGFIEETYASSGGLVTSLTWAPDGSNRLFLTQKAGAIKIVENGVLLTTNFYSFSPYTGSECGVLSLAFDPNYVTNKYIYVFYTASSSVQRIVRLTDVGNVGQNPVTIIDNLPTVGENHDGGSLVIGPDHNGNGNYLYWAIGNLGNSNAVGEGTDLSSLASKVGRANLDGSAPSDNPFYNSADGIGPSDYVWARGFRNPFTMAFQPSNKKLWVNVVGDRYEQIFQVNRGDYAGDRQRENLQTLGPIPSILPKIKYRTNTVDTFTIAAAPSGATRVSGVATFNTTGSSALKLGEKVTISGMADASFDGTFYVTAVPSISSFSVAQAGPNANSGAGTVTTASLGGCVTGGAFYNATGFPTAYRGNYFWGDCNSGKIHRATLNSSNVVTQVDTFLSGSSGIIDVSAGPDGALYYVNSSGTVFRITYVPTSQSIVVSSSNVSINEGGTAIFTVRLSSPPAAPLTVRTNFFSGDSSVTVSSGQGLTFNATNYAQPQTVQLSAAEDADALNGNTVFNVSATGLGAQQVAVSINDNDTLNMLLSASSLNFVEGASGTFSVKLSNQPASSVTINVARSAGDANISVSSAATLNFNSTNYDTAQTVTLSAAEDADSVDDVATISVTSSGLTTKTVAVTVTDNDSQAPLISSTPPTSAVQGALYQYDVNATGIPTPTYRLISPPVGMMINSTSGLISWTPASVGNFAVTVEADNLVLPKATQLFSISVAADQAPSCTLTAPQSGEKVSGSSAEFFGDAFDDVGTIKAEFYIDGVLVYTDVNNEEHFHINGGHARWDTTLLSNGSHLLRMKVFDTSGKSGQCEVSATVANPTTPNAPSNLRVGQ